MKQSDTINPLELDFCPVTGLPITRKPEWTNVKCSENYTVTLFFIGDSIIWILPQGEADSEAVRNILNIVDRIISENIPPDRKYIQIEDIRYVKHISLEARKIYINHMKKKEQILGLIFCGSSLLIKFSIKLAERVTPRVFKVRIVDDYKEAIETAKKLAEPGSLTPHTNDNKEASCNKTQKPEWSVKEKDIKDPGNEALQALSETNGKDEIQTYVADLLQTIGNLEWGKEGHSIRNDIDKSHPFYQVYEIISLVKQDLDVVLAEKLEVENKIVRQNALNGLRAMMWKLASNKSLTTERLIQSLLELAGPVFKVCRACYYKVITGINNHVELKCAYEWKNNGVLSMLGVRWPLRLINSTPKRDFFLIHSANNNDNNESEYDEDAKSFLQYLSENCNIEHTGIMPLYIEDSIDGCFSFDTCWENKDSQPWDDDMVGILNEIALIVSNHDFQKKIEEELFIEKTKYKAIVENINDIVSIADSRGNLKYFSPSVKRILGYAPEELIGRNIIELIPKSEQSNFINKYSLLLAMGEIEPVHSSVITKSGDIKTIEITTKTLNINEGSDINTISLIRDITEKKKTDDELKRSREQLELLVEERTGELEKINTMLLEEINERKVALEALQKSEEQLIKAKDEAEKSNEAKGKFLANVSHEIRTPLNAIIGFCELIQNEVRADKMRDYSQLVISESEILLDLINEFLDQAKIDSGKVKLENIPFDLRNTIESISASMKIRAQKKGLDFIAVIEEKTPTLITGDPTRLRQIIINIVNNAIKFTENGSVIVSVKSLRDYELKTNLYFEIKDTGIGIADDKLPLIFESFVQADIQTARKYGGTGLGTTISKKLVELMGGTIGVKSELGKGSTFWFTIPFTRQFEQFPLKTPEQTSENEIETLKQEDKILKNSEKKILLVEDYGPNRYISIAYLQNSGYKTECAENGKEAVFMCKGEKYDLILMDAKMPEMDGYEATMKIRSENSPNRTTPILGMTAGAYQTDIQKCLDSGMDDVITKPIRRKSFLNTVEKWLNMESNKITSTIQALEEPPPIDFRKTIEELEMTTEFINSVLSGFIVELEEQFKIIENAITSRSFNDIANEAHKIKGGASNLTAYKLSDIAFELEKNALSSNAAEALTAFNNLKNEYLRLKEYWNNGNWEIT